MTEEREEQTEEETETTEPKEALETEGVAEETAEEGVKEETEEEKTVPLAALQESRAKEREAKRQAAEHKRLAEEAAEREAEARRTSAEREEEIDWEALGITPEAAKKLQEINRSDNRRNVVALSEAFAMEVFDDYEETLEKSGFLVELKGNNALAQTIANQASPALAAYRYARGMLDEAEGGNTQDKIDQAKIEGAQEVIEKVTTQKKKGISPKGGGPDVGKLTPSKATDLSPDEWAKLSQEEKDRLMGKPQ